MSDTPTAAETAAPVDAGSVVETVPDIVEPVAAPEPAAVHTETPTLLTGEAAAPEAASADEPAAAAEADSPPPVEETKPPEPEDGAAAEAKPDDAGETAEPPEPEPLTYEPPTLPDGVELDQEQLTRFDAAIGKERVSPETRQQLVDMMLEERQRWEEHARQDQHRVFAQVRQQWREEVLRDDQLGGAAHHTALAACRRVIDEFVPEQDRAAWDQMLNITGGGDHPAMLRFLFNVSRRLGPPGPVMGGAPPADRGGAGGRGRRMRDLYDNPRSSVG
ncbi:MAG: hypothetical protein ACM3II_00090 [Rhodospirillaceae bacterium]